jgi:hypothetical protein
LREAPGDESKIYGARKLTMADDIIHKQFHILNENFLCSALRDRGEEGKREQHAQDGAFYVSGRLFNCAFSPM